MTTHDFKVFLEPDAQYGGYVVVCPSLPGCYAQGKTVSEALANIREAIDLFWKTWRAAARRFPIQAKFLLAASS